MVSLRYLPLLCSTSLSFTPKLTLIARNRLAVSSSASSLQETSSSMKTTTPRRLVEFSKYEGLGNDFILIDNRNRDTPSLTSEESAKLCDRNFGIGGDGVIFALQKPNDSFDFTMRIYNSDGSEPEMCGNGIRCMAQFLKDLGETKEKFTIHTKAGPIVPVLNENDGGGITVDMGAPILDTTKVPTTLSPNADLNSAIEQTYECKNGKTWKISPVSMGNPHAIIFVDNLETDINFEIDGPTLETADIFPAKTNVEFVQILSESHVKVKVWERGAGPTLACGTGACAVAVAAIRAKKVKPDAPICVTLPGGDLFIQWDQETNKIYMTGPATFAFSGSAVVR